MHTHPFTHSEQFRRSKTIDPPTFTPHNPNAKLRLRLFAAGLSTAALLAFIYSVSLSAEPVLISTKIPIYVHESLAHKPTAQCPIDDH
jgi:hypothetical protein